MSNDLIEPEDLSGFPGAPFSEEVVDAAVDELRGLAGWHIAPSRVETVTIDGDGTFQALLPSLYVTAVSAVRDVYTADAPSSITGFRWSKVGIVSTPTRLPCGFQSVEVDLTHGYEVCPDALLPAIVAIAQASTTDVTISQQSAGPFGVTKTNLSTLATWLDRGSAATIARYTIPPRA